MSIIIIGAGPNLGAAVARRFGREGMPVGLIARNANTLGALANDLAGEGITSEFAAADIRDATALSRAVGGSAAGSNRCAHGPSSTAPRRPSSNGATPG